MNIRKMRLATALVALLVATPLSAQTPTGIAPGVITLPPVPGTPLARSQRLSPTALSPVPESLRLHRTDARTQWQSDERFGSRFVWWLDGAGSELVFALRVASGIRYRLACDYAPPAMPVVTVRDLMGTTNRVPNLPADAAEMGASVNFGIGLPGIPDLDGLPTEEQTRTNPRYEYATLRATWRRGAGQDRMLIATIEAVSREAWREVRISNPSSGGTAVLYGCEISPIIG